MARTPAATESISITFKAADPQTPIFKSKSNSHNIHRKGHIWLANYVSGSVDIVFDLDTPGYAFDRSNGVDSAISISTDVQGQNPAPPNTFTNAIVTDQELKFTVSKIDAGVYYYVLYMYHTKQGRRREFSIGDPIIVNR